MDPIAQGMQGAAVEDVQTRLVQLGYPIAENELSDKSFGTSTAQAVNTFRLDNGLPAGDAVDMSCWSTLVDASYKMGDRTLYLRLPNFHGADVKTLQRALNVLGFACGDDDLFFCVLRFDLFFYASFVYLISIFSQASPPRFRFSLTEDHVPSLRPSKAL